MSQWTVKQILFGVYEIPSEEVIIDRFFKVNEALARKHHLTVDTLIYQHGEIDCTEHACHVLLIVHMGPLREPSAV